MRKGLSLIEIVVSIALIAILVGVYFVAANPGGQLASSRNTERSFHLQTIMNYIQQNKADSGTGNFSCSSGPLPTSTQRMASAGAGTYNILPCLANYTNVIPFDPSAPGAHDASPADYDTGYTVAINASGTVTLGAPSAELGKTVSVSR